MTRIVAISDFCDRVPPEPSRFGADDFARAWAGAPPPVPDPRDAVRVTGGYLERLPLAMVAAGVVDHAEVWTFAGSDARFDSRAALDGGPPPGPARDRPGLLRRVFRADGHPAPHGSADMLAHVAAHGAPDILCVWGLGVSAAVMDACASSVAIYNSIDAPAVRIPPDLARRFDIVLAGSEAQAAEIGALCPDALVPVLPIGPEFASDETFRPLDVPKEFDVVYVACAQPYKRHHVLFDALERLPGARALCVMGYGEMAAALRHDAAARGLDVTFVGPPGVDHDGVNALVNRARVGVVCGQADGAPAILTEYMLAGLPVLANERLACGLQFVTPRTGRVASEDGFFSALRELIGGDNVLDPRAEVQARWTWPHGARRLSRLVEEVRSRRDIQERRCRTPPDSPSTTRPAP